jgi:predicted transcriptional regulator
VDGAAGGGGEERLSWDQGWDRLLWSLWWQPPRRLKRRVSLTVAVDEEVAAKARELARARGVSLSALLREAIAQYVAAADPAARRQPDPAAAGPAAAGAAQRGAPVPPPPPELQAALLERLDRIERRLGEVERLLRSIPAAAGPAPAPPAAAPPEPELPDFVRGNPWLSVIAGRGG